MESQPTLRLKDLLKIALGAPEITDVNTAVLYSLIDILLKKFNCHDEKVAFSDYECKSLNQILQTAQISPLPFNDEKLEMSADKLSRLQKLEENVNSLDCKLTHHLQKIQQLTELQNNEFTWDDWAKNGCEDLCTACDPNNELACRLIQDIDLLKKLLRRIAAPIIDRVFILEDKIKILHDEFQTFFKRIEEQYLKVELLHSCFEEIEILRTKINENHMQFLYTMEEVQDMLDSKLDKIHMPALKKYIHDRFSQIDRDILLLQNKKNCPQSAGIVMDNMRCLSCRNTKVCSNVSVQKLPLMKDATPKKPLIIREKTRFCGCSPPILASTSQKTQVHSVNLSDCAPQILPSTSQKTQVHVINLSECVNLQPPKGKHLKCDQSYKINLEMGSDGNYYRMG